MVEGVTVEKRGGLDYKRGLVGSDERPNGTL